MLEGPSRVLQGHKDDILCVARGADSALATGSYDGEIVVWNIATCSLLGRMRADNVASLFLDERWGGDALQTAFSLRFWPVSPM